ncbi:hypothetical protein CDD83_635 [Cordyceps sp. RAO-2017]|nr:hypothetical protein CDD83_635 [Cordyceps sp. RAO-2017]
MQRMDATFRNYIEQLALPAKKPLLFHNGTASPATQLPALHKWFSKDESTERAFAAYMMKFQESGPFPYELTLPSPEATDAVARFRDWLTGSADVMDHVLAGIIQSTLSEGEGQTFFQLYSPLRLLIRALEFNRSQESKAMSTLHLYIAQSALGELPSPLQDDLPTPWLVQRTGHVYSSSIWLGTTPTYTPLHRDPNPNLFCQLCGSKVVRLLPPSSGDRLFFEVQVKIRQRGNSRIRTSEMMEGPERQALHEAVWNPDTQPEELHEVELSAGDALFIPVGWWHSVKSREADSQLNGSVNWWFR